MYRYTMCMYERYFYPFVSRYVKKENTFLVSFPDMTYIKKLILISVWYAASVLVSVGACTNTQLYNFYLFHSCIYNGSIIFYKFLFQLINAFALIVDIFISILLYLSEYQIDSRIFNVNQSIIVMSLYSWIKGCLK